MGIVAYYVDVNAAQFAALKAKPALVWNIASDPRFAKASMVDVDKDWEVLSWIASSKKRVEKCHEAAWNKAFSQDVDSKQSREAFLKSVAQSAQDLACPPDDGEVDPLLKAIEGRGTEKQREPALDFGMGAARVFSPAEVELLAASFARFDLVTFRRNFDRKEMARFDVGGMDWETESDTVLDEFLLPSFKAIRDFYQKAARLKHHVLVIYQ